MSKKKKKKSNQNSQRVTRKTSRIKAAFSEKGSSFQISRNEFFILLFMSFFVFILYANTLDFPFHFDDEVTILKNKNLHLTEINRAQVSSLFKSIYNPRPLPKISFALNYYFGGKNTFGYHLVNIVIHILNGILVFYFVKITMSFVNNKNLLPVNRQTKSDSELLIPLFSSLIWLVHPLQTNSVTYIVQRMNSMASMFFMLSMLLYIEGRRIQIKKTSAPGQKTGNRKSDDYGHLLYFTGCVTAGLLSVGCKENSITLPFFIVLYEFYFFQNLALSWLKKLVFWFSVLSLFLIVIFKILIGFVIITKYFNLYYDGYSFTMYQRALTEFRVVIYYIFLFFFPHPDRLNFDYDFPLSYSLINPLTTLLSLFTLTGLIAVAVIYAKKERLLSFGIIWFLGNLVMESSIIPLDIIFEYRTYLPSILLSVIIVTSIWRLKSSEILKIGLLALSVAILSYWTVQRNLVWSSPIALWQDCVKKAPGKDRPHADLGKAFEMAGRIDEAILEYQKALTINPYHQLVLNNMGLIMYKQGNLDKAIHYYRKALQSDPVFADALNNLGVALIDKKKIEQGISHYKKALLFDPDHPEAPGNLKKAMDGLKAINEKISEVQEKLKRSPDSHVHHHRLGVLFYLKGNFATAIEHYRKALSIKPDHIKSLNGLSAIYSLRKQYDTALSIAKQALELQPENPGAYYNIACIYSLQNNREQAVAWLRKSIDQGFSKWELIKTDKDLMHIRNTESYQNIIKNR